MQLIFDLGIFIMLGLQWYINYNCNRLHKNQTEWNELQRELNESFNNTLYR